MSLMHAFSNEQEEVEQKGLPISSWLKQEESDENMTEGDKSKNTQKTVKAKPVKPGEVKGVKVKNKKIPSNWACDLARGKCIVKDNPANGKDVFKLVEDCIKKTKCNEFIKKETKTRAKATRTTDGKGTRAKTKMYLSPEPEPAKMNKRKSKKRKRKRNKSKNKKKQTKNKSKE
jgi:hypothetical protein